VQGERKQVTVLFADVVGSMTLAAGMDPEDWGELMERFFAILRKGSRRARVPGGPPLAANDPG
jgi:class 3 adenylate cyclase